jgi:pimeloyl-ACP methyl ester carboxylesterase
MSAVIFHRVAVVQGRKIFYREAGDICAPTILFLHGLPGSSAQYTDLILALADRFHLIAPDYIGVGQSEAPLTDAFNYTLEALTVHVEGLLDTIGLTSFLLYMHDCGGPVGFRLFVRDPGRVTGFIIQNANASAEGVSAACFRAFTPLWENRTAKTERAIQAFVNIIGAGAVPGPTLNGPRCQTQLAPAPTALLDLLEDYRTNIAHYPDWQAAFRTYKPPTLIIWGKHDPAFIPPGARAYLEDLPQAKLIWLNAGHAVLDQHFGPVAAEIKAMFDAGAIKPHATVDLVRRRAACALGQNNRPCLTQHSG